MGENLGHFLFPIYSFTFPFFVWEKSVLMVRKTQNPGVKFYLKNIYVHIVTKICWLFKVVFSVEEIVATQ